MTALEQVTIEIGLAYESAWMAEGGGSHRACCHQWRRLAQLCERAATLHNDEAERGERWAAAFPDAESVAAAALLEMAASVPKNLDEPLCGSANAGTGGAAETAQASNAASATKA